MKDGFRTCFWALIAFAGSSTGLMADYKDSYQKGVQALNLRRWQDAARHFRAAIAEQPRDSGEPVNISGMDFRPYLPQYYLGVALKNSGDCEGALVAWLATDKKILAARERDKLNASRRECERVVLTPPEPEALTKPVAPPPMIDATLLLEATSRARTNLDFAEQSERAVAAIQAELLSTRPTVWQERDLGPAHETAVKLLNSARDRFGAASVKSDISGITEAGIQAATVAEQLAAIRRHASAKRDELRREVKSVPPATPAGASNGPSLDLRRSTIAAPNASAATALSSRPTGPARPPRRLEVAYRRFVAGDYSGTRTVLSSARIPAGPAAVQAALFQGAAAYNLYVMTGARDSALLAEARAQIQQCHQLDPSLRLDERVFSPKFIQFFASMRQEKERIR